MADEVATATAGCGCASGGLTARRACEGRHGGREQGDTGERGEEGTTLGGGHGLGGLGVGISVSAAAASQWLLIKHKGHRLRAAPGVAKRRRAGAPRVYRSELRPGASPKSHLFHRNGRPADPLSPRAPLLQPCSISTPIRLPSAARTTCEPPRPPPPLTGALQGQLFHSGKRQCHTCNPKCSAPTPPRAEEAAVRPICTTRRLPAGCPAHLSRQLEEEGRTGREAERRETAVRCSSTRAISSSWAPDARIPARTRRFSFFRRPTRILALPLPRL